MAGLFGGGAAVNVNASGTLVPQVFTPTDGQTVFNLTAFTYTVGSNSLLVFVNGQLQLLNTDFTETSSSRFTLTSPALATDKVVAIGFPLANIIQPSGAFATQTGQTNSLITPSGTTAQRDAAPAFGYLRGNSTLGRLEWYNGSTWVASGAGAALPILLRDGVTTVNAQVS